MPEAQPLIVEKNGKPECIKSDTFPVKEGDLLKIRAAVIDAEDAINERALVCTIRFFDEKGTLIERAYEGASVSAVYGSYVYVESKRDGDAIPWIKEVIVAPIGAHLLELELHPWKSSPAVTVLGDIECLDIRRIPTDEISWNLSAGEIKTENYEILPFWRSLCSFDVLRKTTGIQDEIRIKISFIGRDGSPIDVKTAVCNPIIGMVNVEEAEALVAIPVAQQCQYEDYERLVALIQLIPPTAAISAVVTVCNPDDTYSVRVSQRIFAFDTLIESRLAADSGDLIARSVKLPANLAQLSFVKLQQKRPDDLSVYEAALGFYLATGNTDKITTTANLILNRFQDGKLCSKARNALALVTEIMPSWQPSVARIADRQEIVSETAFKLKVGHFLRTIEIDEGDAQAGLAWDLIRAQKESVDAEPFVILPLGYPEKGEHGLPWERSDLEGIACYYLNCLSTEQLQAVPVTSQLNFSAVLAGDVLVRERAELIHVQEGERGYDFALVGLALARALHVPLVYQKYSYFEGPTSAYASHQTLDQARAMREYQCMIDADAVIVSSEAQRASMANAGIAVDKVFVWPASEGGDVRRDRSVYGGKITELCRHTYTYARRVNQKKYAQ
ncbi:glycosyltransferase family 4 protein [Advenella incenata]